MKKFIVIILVILFTVLACIFGYNMVKNSMQYKEEKSEVIPEKKIDIVEEKINSMSLEEKIAQMLVISCTGNSIDENLENVMSKVKPGGVILFSNNISTFENTRNFISKLKGYNEIPLIVSIDEEGGNVQRLKNISDKTVTDIPFMYNVGQTEDELLSYNVGKVIAEELRTIGVNVDFAPVLDIYLNENNTVIGKRSFGNTKELVSKMAISLAKGMEDSGVVATFKHFPGHGDTEVDSHIDLPVLDKDYNSLKENEFYPFKKATKQNAKMIMVGHLAVPKVTGNNEPTTLSKKMITDILRKELNYDGVVITDALNMGAIVENYEENDIYIKAVEAGCDLLLMPKDINNAIKIIKENFSEERINESVRRILKLKYNYLKDYELLDETYLNSKEHQEIVGKVK